MDFWNQTEGAKKKASLILLAILIAGIVGGYFAGRWHGQRIAFAFASRQWGGAQGRVHFMERLQQDLSLRADQREKMGTSLRLYHQRMMTLRNQYRPQIDGLIQEATQELRGFLDEAQREKFDVMVQHHRERRHQRGMRRMHRFEERLRTFKGEAEK
ncbi:MAG: hypothetical protein O2807_12575 [bacterium]|nr:hypothetical protein [bacterium]